MVKHISYICNSFVFKLGVGGLRKYWIKLYENNILTGDLVTAFCGTSDYDFQEHTILLWLDCIMMLRRPALVLIIYNIYAKSGQQVMSLRVLNSCQLFS